MTKSNIITAIIIIVLLALVWSGYRYTSVFDGLKSRITVDRIVEQHDTVLNYKPVYIPKIVVKPVYYRIVNNDTICDTNFVPVFLHDSIISLPFVAILDTTLQRDSFHVEFHYPEIAFMNFCARHKPDTITIPQIIYKSTETYPTWLLIASHTVTALGGLYLGSRLTK